MRSTLHHLWGAEKPLTTDIKIALDMSNWEEFTYQDLFDIKKGVRLTKAQMLVGNTPLSVRLIVIMG